MPAAIVKCENGYPNTMIQITSELNMVIKMYIPLNMKYEYFNIYQKFPNRRKNNEIIITHFCYENRCIFYHGDR